MPLYTDPTARIKLVLDSDKDKENPPTFIYRALNGREWRRVAKVFDALQAGEVDGMAAQLDAIYETVSIGLLDWVNMFDPSSGEAIPFNVEDIDLVLNPIEASTDLMGKLLGAVVPTHEDKKKSDSQAVSETD
tara:strand:- start:3639 stop:4037 length:399 start_codon:yes stop_codon:yes gene_type:complete